MDNRIEIDMTTSRQPSGDWQRLALKKAKAACAARGIEWENADVFVKLPESGRCFTKEPGFDSLVAHG